MIAIWPYIDSTLVTQVDPRGLGEQVPNAMYSDNGTTRGEHASSGIQSADAAGNTDPGVSSGTFTVDNVAPTVSIGAPSAGITDSVTPVFFTLTYELPPTALVAPRRACLTGPAPAAFASSTPDL